MLTVTNVGVCAEVCVHVLSEQSQAPRNYYLGTSALKVPLRTYYLGTLGGLGNLANRCRELLALDVLST